MERSEPDASDRWQVTDRASYESILTALLPAYAALYVKDREGRYLTVTAAGAAEIGYHVDEIIGQTDRQVFPGVLGERLWRSDQEIMASGEARTVEEPVIVAGEARTYLSSKAPLRDARGEVIGIVGTSIDASALTDADVELRRREAQLATAQALTQVGSWEWEIATNETRWSEEVYRITGRDPARFQPTYDAIFALVDPDDREGMRREIERATAPGSDGLYRLEHRIVRPDGAVRQCVSRGRVLFDLDGSALRMIGAIQDVTDQRETEERLQRSQRQLSIAQELAGLGSWEWDPSADQVTWSKGMFRIFGLLPGEFAGTLEAALERLHPADRFEEGQRLERTLTLGVEQAAEMRVLRPDGEIRIIRSSTRRVADRHGAGVRVIGACEDITERKHYERDLERSALRDSLTGLPNRALAFDRLRHAFELTRRTDAQLVVLYVDLDGFKAINDSHGHDVGDQVLLGVARRLRELVRPSDTLGRLGGDEFLVICEDVLSPEAATDLAERVRGGLGAPFPTSATELRLSASVGLATSSDRHGKAEDVLREADEAMYEAKREGGDRVRAFRPEG